MLSFLKKLLFNKPATEQVHGGNPGQGSTASLDITCGERQWHEELDLVALLAKVCRERGVAEPRVQNERVQIAEGFSFWPQLVDVHVLENGQVQTVSTIEVTHPHWIPNGFFDYQHGGGPTVAESLSKGFGLWVDSDLPALLDLGREQPEFCTLLKADDSQNRSAWPTGRRVLLGPVAHFVKNGQNASATTANSSDEHPPFCPCCMLTQGFDAFRPLVFAEEFYALRLFASRSEQGQPDADCRVNGEDFPTGANALRAQVATWPPHGFEFRKQLVIIYTVPTVTPTSNTASASPPARTI
jgi:hypothetical protein